MEIPRYKLIRRNYYSESKITKDNRRFVRLRTIYAVHEVKNVEGMELLVRTPVIAADTPEDILLSLKKIAELYAESDGNAKAIFERYDKQSFYPDEKINWNGTSKGENI